MSLSSLQLDAFHAVARSGNFSRAAKELHITQSALTQRVQNLEDELDTALFVRHPRGAFLTDSGERLLQYCETRLSIENELLNDLKGSEDDRQSGVLRLAGFSTITRSILIQALSPLLRDNPGITSHVYNGEMRELPNMLLSNQVDYIVVDSEIDRSDLQVHYLGSEENVMVTSKEHKAPKDIFLDHDPEDPTTHQFFKQQGGEPPAYERRFFDEIYGIIDGVAMGLGRAIVPRHLAKSDERIRIVSGHTPLAIPLYLHYRKRPYYTRLHEQIVQVLTKECKKHL